MQAQIGRAYESTPLAAVEEGLYRVKLDAPETGYTAYYVELVYENGFRFPLKFSTGTKVVPDTVEFEWEMAPASARE
jgi:PhoPQ-activated pathogenicity-related protein